MSVLSIKRKIKRNLPGFRPSNRGQIGKKINLTPAKRFTLIYEKDNGRVGTYIVSLPIEIKEGQMSANMPTEIEDGKVTVYSFNKHGIRSFKMSHIVSLEEVKD